MTEQLKAAINNTATQLRLIEKQIQVEKDWLKLEALKNKHNKLDNECLSMMIELKLLTEGANVQTR